VAFQPVGPNPSTAHGRCAKRSISVSGFSHGLEPTGVD